MQWITSKYEGVRYCEHKSRRHGRNADRYIVIRYRISGKRIEEVIGWTSQGASLERAAELLGILRQNHRTGAGPQTLKEMRAAEKEKRERAAAANIPDSFAALFELYLESAKVHKSSWRNDQEIFRYRLKSLHQMPLPDISPAVMTQLRDTLSKTYAPASVRHALALVRRVWRWAAVQYAPAWDAAVLTDPLRGVRMPIVKNQRLSYLTPAEVQTLLNWCASHDPIMHDVIMLAVYTGMRRSELARLKIGHINTKVRIISIVDPKSGVTLETVTFPAHLDKMLQSRIKGRKNSAYVFPSAITDGPMHNLSVRFAKAAQAVGLNEDIPSPHYIATLHTLRHTFISWAVIQGIDLRTVQEMARHRSFDMTLRYAHLAPRACHDAVNQLPKVAGSHPVAD